MITWALPKRRMGEILSLVPCGTSVVAPPTDVQK
jgi:hypothetical protein